MRPPTRDQFRRMLAAYTRDLKDRAAMVLVLGELEEVLWRRERDETKAKTNKEKTP